MDSHFGILSYWTKNKGIGGSIKQKIDDFIVEELPLELPEGDTYVTFLVEKRGLSTFEAVQKIAQRLHIDKRSVSYAGLKDRYAVTRQWMSIPSINEDKIRSLKIPGITIVETKRTGDGLRLGDLVGNRFTVTVRGLTLTPKELEKRLRTLVEEIEERGIPNFFGGQRFGQNRPLTHIVGRHIIKGDFDRAVFDYLTLDSEDETTDVRQARSRLKKERDYKAALDYFPKGLAYERVMIDVIADKTPLKYDMDALEDEVVVPGAIKALRSLSIGLTKLFIDAYQSYIFNRALSLFIANKETIDNFPAPIVGYQTTFSKSEFDSIVKHTLKEEGVKPEDFLITRMPELSSKGTFRSVMIYPQITYSVKSGSARLSFDLKKGAYATVVLREITKPDA